ncbi:MAG: signal peptidase I [Verrucomicrobia bacterium]|nr:signal peptidase I [Verrucomicrobiota bacterium]
MPADTTHVERRGAARMMKSVFTKPIRWRGGTLLCLGLWAALSFAVCSRYGAKPIVISGESMTPTLQPGEIRLAHRWLALLQGYHRGDIALIRDRDDNQFSIKRIVALPHDQLQFKNGSVYLNGRVLMEPYLPKDVTTLNPRRAAENVIELGSDEFFVLGDNREISLDSRYLGPVPGNRLLGKLRSR